MARFFVRLFSFLVLSLLSSGSASGASITLDATARGAYDSLTNAFATGGAGTSTGNYLTGQLALDQNHSFFVFDLTSVSTPFTDASFVFDSAEIVGDPTETLALFDYIGSISALLGNTAGAAGFADLGSGTSFGSVTVTTASPGLYTITFNAAGLAALNAALGNEFAMGGALTSIGGSGDQFVGGFSLGASHVTQLQGNVGSIVPEPASLMLLGAGLMGVALRRRLARG